MYKLLGKNPNPYGDIQKMEFVLPTYFLEVCKMLGQQPVGVIFDFMVDVGKGKTAENNIITLSGGSSFMVHKQYGKDMFVWGGVKEMMVELVYQQGLMLAGASSTVHIGKFDEIRQAYWDAWRLKWAALKKGEKTDPDTVARRALNVFPAGP